MKIVCQFCESTVEATPANDRPISIVELPTHWRATTPPTACPGSLQRTRTPSPEATCVRCGGWLSLAVRSRPSVNERRHASAECIVALRGRIEELERILRVGR